MKQIVIRTQLSTAVMALCLALSAFAYGDSTAVATAAALHKPEKAKKGMVTISATTDIGGLTLEPGEYEVKPVMRSAIGAVIRFTRYTYDPYAQEGLPVHQWDRIGEVKVTAQPLASKAAHTELKLEAEGNKAIALQIRGNSFEYLF